MHGHISKTPRDGVSRLLNLGLMDFEDWQISNECLNNVDSCWGRRRLDCVKQGNGKLILIIDQSFLNDSWT